MPMVEVDEVQLQQSHRLKQTMENWLKNPKAKRKILEAVKDADPNARIPELEIEEAARAPVMALETQVAELTKQIATDKADREKEAKLNALSGNVEKGKAKLRKEGWTDEGVAAVEKLMEEKGILDVEIAAAFYEKQHPPQAPATPSGVGSWNFMEPVSEEDAYTKAIVASKEAANNEQLVMREANKALQEFRGAQRR